MSKDFVFFPDFNLTVILWQPALPDITPTSPWHHADITWFLKAWADDIIKDDPAVGAAVELPAVHGQCEDPAHPGIVSAQVWKLLFRGTSLQVELRHGVRRSQTLNAQEVVTEETGRDVSPNETTSFQCCVALYIVVYHCLLLCYWRCWFWWGVINCRKPKWNRIFCVLLQN